ncbi:MAG: hypothetical protein GY845_37795 [Planctomycetes bacterium]|nr:hypothetical protein [Planctomycetota bacterium]
MMNRIITIFLILVTGMAAESAGTNTFTHNNLNSSGITGIPRSNDFELMELGGYHNYAAIKDDLNAYAERYPEICRLYSLGQSVRRRELWAILITNNPDEEEDEPEFKYISTIHGNEPEGTEMCLYFIDLLLRDYGTDERITNLVDTTAIWIVPLMNPDGFESGVRNNANHTDLNRDFPSAAAITENIFEGGLQDISTHQPEVQHIMDWTAKNSFVLSANFHIGEAVVLYPYAYTNDIAPDDELLRDISSRYSMHNTMMLNNRRFTGGIVNGAGWYIHTGTLMDWCYSCLSCNAVTIELVKNQTALPESEIPALWLNNRESMLSFLEAVHIGIRGLVTDKSTGEPLMAEVWVEGNGQPVFTDPNVGDYHRMLLPGTYNLIFNAPGYVSRSVNNITVEDGPAVRMDVELMEEQSSPDFNRDGNVDLKDLEKLLEHWGQNEPSVDIAPLPDGDGTVDYKDLALLIEYWQEEVTD